MRFLFIASLWLTVALYIFSIIIDIKDNKPIAVVIFTTLTILILIGLFTVGVGP